MKKLFLNPFEKISETKLLLFGIAITLIGSYLGYMFNGRFIGIFSFKTNDEVILTQSLIDNGIDLFSITLFLFFFGRIINKKTRFIDILIPSLVARLPIYLLAFTNTNNFIADLSNSLMSNLDVKNPAAFHIETADLIILLVFAAISIGSLVWSVTLLFKGFKIATNCKTLNHTLLFATGIILAEVLSQTLIYFINY